MVPPSAALVAMEAGARRDAIDDALARLMAEGLATSEEVPGSKVNVLEHFLLSFCHWNRLTVVAPSYV